jgi:predicted nucleotidyltransferase
MVEIGLREAHYHMVMNIADPVLARLRDDLDAAFGSRIERVVLYGSRARGDAQPDSDYDVAVFLRDYVDRRYERPRLSVVETEVFDTTGGLVHSLSFKAGTWNDRSPLMAAIRRDGIDL